MYERLLNKVKIIQLELACAKKLPDKSNNHGNTVFLRLNFFVARANLNTIDTNTVKNGYNDIDPVRKKCHYNRFVTISVLILVKNVQLGLEIMSLYPFSGVLQNCELEMNDHWKKKSTANKSE